MSKIASVWKSCRLAAMVGLSVGFAGGLSSGLSSGGGRLTADEPAHLLTAATYVAAIQPAKNVYGSPLSVAYVNGVLNAKTKCGSYAAHLFKATYSSMTNSVFTGLFGSSSPEAQLWYAGIASEAEYSNADGTFSANLVATVPQIGPGDVLAAAYSTSGGATGHVMVVDWLEEIGEEPLSGNKIPGFASAIRWEVRIHDSTSSPHGIDDTRTDADLGGADDNGLGQGTIVVYEDPATEAIIGWRWSATSTTVYQCVHPLGANYRPMVAGFLAGPGITE